MRLPTARRIQQDARNGGGGWVKDCAAGIREKRGVRGRGGVERLAEEDVAMVEGKVGRMEEGMRWRCGWGGQRLDLEAGTRASVQPMVMVVLSWKGIRVIDLAEFARGLAKRDAFVSLVIWGGHAVYCHFLDCFLINI